MWFSCTKSCHQVVYTFTAHGFKINWISFEIFKLKICENYFTYLHFAKSVHLTELCPLPDWGKVKVWPSLKFSNSHALITVVFSKIYITHHSCKNMIGIRRINFTYCSRKVNFRLLLKILSEYIKTIITRGLTLFLILPKFLSLKG